MFIFVLQDEGLVENDLEGEVNEKMLLRQQLYELREQRLVFRSALFQLPLNTSLHFLSHSESLGWKSIVLWDGAW